MSEYANPSSATIGRLISQLETCLLEPKSELQKRRLQNFYATAKYHGVPLPALRALLEGRRRLRLARLYVEKLPPHRRAEVAKLAQAIGDTSELFQFEPSVMSFNHLQVLR